MIQNQGQFDAKVDTHDEGIRYQMFGPPRGDNDKQAFQDLCCIRSAAEGVPTHTEKLQAMQEAAKLLQDGARARARGAVSGESAGRFGGRISP